MSLFYAWETIQEMVKQPYRRTAEQSIIAASRLREQSIIAAQDLESAWYRVDHQFAGLTTLGQTTRVVWKKVVQAP